MSTSIIDDFINQYLREYDYYQEVARLCASLCEIDLEQNGIRAIVTSRAKRPDRLLKKLEARHIKKKYKKLSDIYEDIVDLAGVRIALYFPGDRENVEKLLNVKCSWDKPKVFPELRRHNNKGYKKRFTGYHAFHYRVKLREDQLSESQARYALAMVEIQVASVLMHGWAEVEHDLIYKPLKGRPSDDEYAILDELNGIVLAGEIALERLQKEMERRSQSGAFRNHYDLASFLQEAIKPLLLKDQQEPIVGRVDVLYKFLQIAELNDPNTIKNAITELDMDRPIAEQVADQIISADEKRYRQYAQARQEVGSRNPYGPHYDNNTVDDYPNALGHFLSRWSILEGALRSLNQVDINSKPRTILTRDVIKGASFFDPLLQMELERVRRLRNQAVHGLDRVSEASMYEAAKIIERALVILRPQVDEEMQKIIDLTLNTPFN